MRRTGLDPRDLTKEAEAAVKAGRDLRRMQDDMTRRAFEKAKAVALTGGPDDDDLRDQFERVKVAEKAFSLRPQPYRPAVGEWGMGDPEVATKVRELHNADVGRMATSEFGDQADMKLSMSDEGYTYMPKGVTDPGSIGYDWHEAGYGAPGQGGIGAGDNRKYEKQVGALGWSSGLAQQQQFAKAQNRFRAGKGVKAAPSQWDGFQEAAQDGANLQGRINNQWSQAMKGARNAY